MMGILVNRRENLWRAPTKAVAFDDAAMLAVRNPSPEIILDVSRLLSRVLHSTPTGIDRVEMAYAQGLPKLVGKHLRFAATHPLGFYSSLSTDAVQDFLAEIAQRWREGGVDETRRERWRHILRMGALACRRAGVGAVSGRTTYLHLSPRSLEREGQYQRVLRKERARLVCFLHDLIPLQYPHFARPKSVALFERRLQTILRLADGLLVNSQTTAMALKPYLKGLSRDVPVHIAPLGVSPVSVPPVLLRSGEPYFVVVSTIEPRKNHLLLLQIWQQLFAELGPEKCPILVLVGRRGWENENVIAVLDRCVAIKHVICEFGRLSDQAMARLLRGATALLSPSFAEGYGLPVAEALAMGVPVIASDIPAHREVGRDVPDYLDPLDGPAWRSMILEYCEPASLRVLAQKARLAGWVTPSWDSHLRSALTFATDLNHQGSLS